jgi:nitrous oxide reductase accessory protein NosL
MMRTVIMLSLVVLMVLGVGQAMGGEHEDIAIHPECPYCGMDRAKFAHSRMQLTYDDHSTLGFCSVHCVAIDMALYLDKSPIAFSVGDFNTRKLIDAEMAYWVMGGDKPGVMTRRPKWAFEKKSDADQFVKAHGGQPATFEAVIEAAYADMYQDTKMIRQKRKMMREEKMKHQHNKE